MTKPVPWWYNTLMRASSAYAVAGVVVRNGVVVDAAPIVRKSVIGLRVGDAARLLRARGYQLSFAPEDWEGGES